MATRSQSPDRGPDYENSHIGARRRLRRLGTIGGRCHISQAFRRDRDHHRLRRPLSPRSLACLWQQRQANSNDLEKRDRAQLALVMRRSVVEQRLPDRSTFSRFSEECIPRVARLSRLRRKASFRSRSRSRRPLLRTDTILPSAPAIARLVKFKRGAATTQKRLKRSTIPFVYALITESGKLAATVTHKTSPYCRQVQRLRGRSRHQGLRCR